MRINLRHAYGTEAHVHTYTNSLCHRHKRTFTSTRLLSQTLVTSSSKQNKLTYLVPKEKAHKTGDVDAGMNRIIVAKGFYYTPGRYAKVADKGWVMATFRHPLKEFLEAWKTLEVRRNTDR